MEITCEKGDRIVLTDNCSQTFFGVVKSVNPDLGRVVLTNIVQLPQHKTIIGYRNFDKNEIIEIKKYEVSNPDTENREQKQQEKSTLKLPESDFNKIKKLQNEYRYIKDLGTNFHSAVSLLNTCDKIGIFSKDVSKGRFGRASVLAISTPLHLFLFDIQVLGDDVFNKGLKNILESPDIVKVVYDCRLLSDCLKHKHLVNLKNIRDVEAEDIMVVFQDRRMIRRHSRSLEYLIRMYLGVEVESCDEKGDIWNERPLQPNLLESVVSFASFLIPLQGAIERKYLQKLIDASNIYNIYVKNLDFFEILHDEPKKTLKKQISKLVIPQNQTRTYKSRKNS